MVPAMNGIYETRSGTDAVFDIVSPVDGRTVATQKYLSAADADAALKRATVASRWWRDVSLEQRIRTVRDFVEVLVSRRESLADLVMWLIGRPAQQADELSRVVAVADDLIVRARRELVDVAAHSEGNILRFVRREPKGVCLAICAWNYPVAMAGGMSIAALLAGNAVLLKHAPQTGPIADFLAEVWREAGGAPDVFQSVHLDHETSERLLASGSIQSVQFIGSDVGGRAVYRAAAAGFATAGLELGGKDPAYVRADANLDAAIPALVAGSFDNAGQSCCSVERIYVHDAIYEIFVDRFVNEMRKLHVGDPRCAPDIGPVVGVTAARRIRNQIAEARAEGATVISHDTAFDGDSAYVAPTVLLGVAPDAAAMQDESFGPLVCISRVSDDVEAVASMNHSRYGLTASIWSTDVDYAVSLGRGVSAGLCYVNRCDHADLNLPWGGVKSSGIGRTYGPTAFDEYTVTKAFHVQR